MSKKTSFSDIELRDIIIEAYSINSQFGSTDKKYLEGYRDALTFISDMTYNRDK